MSTCKKGKTPGPSVVEGSREHLKKPYAVVRKPKHSLQRVLRGSPAPFSLFSSSSFCYSLTSPNFSRHLTHSPQHFTMSTNATTDASNASKGGSSASPSHVQVGGTHYITREGIAANREKTGTATGTNPGVHGYHAFDCPQDSNVNDSLPKKSTQATESAANEASNKD